MLRTGLLAGTTLAAALAVVATVQHPGLLRDSAAGVYLALLAVGLAVVVLAATLGTSASTGPVWQAARHDGSRLGLPLGALWIVEMTVANLGYGLGRWPSFPTSRPSGPSCCWPRSGVR